MGKRRFTEKLDILALVWSIFVDKTELLVHW